MAKRIGIEAQRLFRAKKHGVEIVCLELLREIRKLQTANEYYVFVKQDNDHCLDSSDHCKIEILPSRLYPMWEQSLLPRAIKPYNLDLLHCTGNTAPAKSPVPLLLTLHDIIFLEDKSFSGNAYQNWGNLYRRWIVPRVIHKCRSILTVSHFEKQRIVDYFHLKEDQVRVIYNGVSENFKPYNAEALENFRKKYELPQQFILFFGNTNPKKNTRGVLKAYHQYLNNHPQSAIPLVITDCSRNYIHRLCRFMGLGNMETHIISRKYIPFSDMPYLYNLATLFLYPSQREAFGLPIIESMACGTPVITANNSSMPEIAGDAALLVCANDPMEIASAIEKLLSEETLYRQKREQGILRAARFNWSHTAKEMLRCYDSLS